jgi:hypothetical protein
VDKSKWIRFYQTFDLKPQNQCYRFAKGTSTHESRFVMSRNQAPSFTSTRRQTINQQRTHQMPVFSIESPLQRLKHSKQSPINSRVRICGGKELEALSAGVRRWGGRDRGSPVVHSSRVVAAEADHVASPGVVVAQNVVYLRLRPGDNLHGTEGRGVESARGSGLSNQKGER